MTRLKKALCLLVFVLTLGPLATPCLALSVSEEKELGEKYMDYLQQHMQFIEDPVIVEPVRRIGAILLQGVPAQPFEFRFFVANESVYNAFAGPGGFVVINAGLIEALTNEDQLAGIMAHEIAHVTCRHISEKIDKNKKVSAASAVGMIASLIAGFPAGAVLSSAGATSTMLAYSRADESQADEIGVQYLLKAGYSGQGLVEAMQVMRSKTWFGKDQIPDYLSTHPAVEDRFVNLNTWLQANPQAQHVKRQIDPYPYNKMRIRLSALYGDPDFALDKLAKSVQNNPDLPLLHYGYGTILARTNNRSLAVEELKKALALSPFDPDILTELGKAQFEAGQVSEALASLTSATEAAPRGVSGFLWLGRVQMESGNLENAARSLEKAREINNKDDDIYYYLGQVYGRMNTLDKAHYFLGVYHMRRHDTRNADFHLKKALSLAANNPELEEKIKNALEKMADRGGKKKGKDGDNKDKDQEKDPDASFNPLYGWGSSITWRVEERQKTGFGPIDWRSKEFK
ncbi:MAG: M48 family metalloprotease [Desulfatibacillum sp.]|nr:M48 family metalloprotease [Desulfatibacillum sp.]